MKTFTYKGTKGGEIIINDHNDIIDDIYFHEYTIQETNEYGNVVTHTILCQPLIKIKSFKYFDSDKSTFNYRSIQEDYFNSNYG